jgi:NTE family protein
MKRIFYSFIIVFFASILHGQEVKTNPKIGLVLSGGGAKGFAHVGVLKVLEEAKIPVDYIAGTSIGSIVGGLYSCGYDAMTLEKLVKSQDWTNLLSNEYKSEFANPFDKTEESRYAVSFPFEQKKLALSDGILNGQNALEYLTYLTIGYHDVFDFSKLPIPFLCIATDLATGDEVVLNKGCLPKAIRASFAVPAAFTSTEIDGKKLVDGGIVNNYPVDRCREMGADIIIGVDITDSLMTSNELKDIPDVIAQMISFMGKQKKNENVRAADINIRPYLRGFSAADFGAESAIKMIQLGEEAARRALPQLIRLRDSLRLEVKPRIARQPIGNDSTLVISNIEVTGTDRTQIAFYLGQVGIKHNQRVTMEHLRNGISRLYSTGNYEFVNFQVVGNRSKTLQIEVKERKNNKINAGLRYDSDYKSSMLLNLTLRNQNFFGSRLSVDAKLSEYPMFAAHYSLDRGWKPGFFSKILYVEDRFNRYEDDKKTAEIDKTLINLQLASHSYLNDATRFTIGGSMDSYRTGSVIGDTTGYNIFNETYFNLFSKIEHNSLDKVYFPTRGVMVGGGIKILLNKWSTSPVMIGDFVYARARSLSDRIVLRYGLDSRLVFGENESFFHRTNVGGLKQPDYFENNIAFNGLRRMELMTGSIGVGRLEARLKMWEKVYVSLSGDFGMYSEDNLFFSKYTTIYGYGFNVAYDSVVGPLMMNLSMSSVDKSILPFFSLGFWF